MPPLGPWNGRPMTISPRLEPLVPAGMTQRLRATSSTEPEAADLAERVARAVVLLASGRRPAPLAPTFAWPTTRSTSGVVPAEDLDVQGVDRQRVRRLDPLVGLDLDECAEQRVEDVRQLVDELVERERRAAEREVGDAAVARELRGRVAGDAPARPRSSSPHRRRASGPPAPSSSERSSTRPSARIVWSIARPRSGLISVLALPVTAPRKSGEMPAAWPCCPRRSRCRRTARGPGWRRWRC